MSVRTRDTSGSLTRQSLMVAGFCSLADTLTFYYEGAGTCPAGPFWCLLVAIFLADAALASSTRLSGVVALLQAVLAVAGGLTLSGSGPLPHLNDTGTLIAAYRAGAWLRGLPAVLALLVLSAGSVTTGVLDGGHLTEWRPLLLSAVREALLAWLVGRYTAARGAHIAELEQRAERERERARQDLTDAVAEERSAIARDLHDVIAHHVSAIGVHAGAARLGLPDKEASPVALSLAAVETSSRAALLDLRRLLDFLHDRPAEGARQPGLDNLDELMDAVRAAGLRTTVSVEGVRRPLDGSLDIAVYRVVQELLTNALRHGDGRVEVTLRYAPSVMSVTAVNPIAPAGRLVGNSPHRGLEGISSRAGMFNGRARYGPVNGGADWKTTVTFSMDAT
ncbi:sensor histidine kinase [Streptomyces tremellae]|uniref:histidine kinase n=1 Tax=Streptomyces tremellae TaxID=1124239 RepID=A0ABP7G1Q6_9ACTN